MEDLPEGWMTNQVGGGEEEGEVEAAEAEVWEVPGYRRKIKVLPEGWMAREQQDWLEDHKLPEGWIPRCPVDPSTASTTGGLASVTFVGGCQRQGL